MRNLRRGAWFLIGLLVGSLFLGTALALTAKSFKYSSPRTAYLTLNPAGFAPDHLGNPANDYDNDYGSTTITSPGDDRCFADNVNLPQGSKIINLKIYYASGQAADPGIEANLRRSDVNTGNPDILARVPFVDTDDVRTGTSDPVAGTANRTVNNKIYAYTVLACLDESREFGGARITYRYANAGD